MAFNEISASSARTSARIDDPTALGPALLRTIIMTREPSARSGMYTTGSNLLEILLTNRRREADDGGAGCRHGDRGVRHREADSAAYRILIRKEHRGQALIDDGALGSRHGIPIDERPSAQQSQAERFKVAASNRHVRDDRL